MSYPGGKGRTMTKNKFIGSAIDGLVKKLSAEYGFCGIMEMPDGWLVNTQDDRGETIKIRITLGESKTR